MDFLVANAEALLFWFFAALVVVSAILVVTLRNPMYGAIALLVSFLSVAVLAPSTTSNCAVAKKNPNMVTARIARMSAHGRCSRNR